MKKITFWMAFHQSTLLVLFVTAFSFGQSLVIEPAKTIMTNNNGDNTEVRSSSNFLGIQSLRYNGTVASKTAVVNNDFLFRIGAGGFYNSSNSTIEKASILFRAAQNWNNTSMGTKILFTTTANNTSLNTERMVIENNGNVGIANSNPTAKLHINHFASIDSPHLHLQSTGTNSSIIKASSTSGSTWDNHFIAGSNGQTSLVYWVNSINSSTPLILTGNGDAIIERNTTVGGFTSLGGGTAPSIKMKELSLSSSTTSGGFASIEHGLTLSKILSVSVLVNAASGNDIPPGYGSTVFVGYQYFFYVTSTQVIIENSAGNHTYIAGRPVKILITYKE